MTQTVRDLFRIHPATAVLTASLWLVLAASPVNGADADIVDTAVANGNFTTLAKALAATDLVGVLKGEGPFTVFAPTDEAFAKLPAGTLEALLKNLPRLKSILTYHVVPGRVTAADVIELKTAKTVNGKSLKIQNMGAEVWIGEARVVAADVEATNGVIHVIDTVLIPN